MTLWRQACLPLLVLATACSSAVPSPGADRRPGTPLIKPFSSYMSQEEARSAAPDTKWAPAEPNLAPARGECPARSFRTLVAKVWLDRGVHGELTLAFLDDALLSTIFYPSRVEPYLTKLAMEGLVLDPDAEEPRAHQIRPRTELDSAVDADDRTYVRWQDAALAAEDETWISACS